MTDVMVDIETVATPPGPAAIASIGAVRFDREAGITEEFFESVSIADCQAHGLPVEWDTMSWWMNQPQIAQEQLYGGRDLDSVLSKFSAFVSGADAVWANSPRFDCMLLREAFDAVGRQPPWEPWDERDYRTLREELDEWPDREQETTEHDGLDDARFQADCLIDALRGGRDE